jgi:ABC-2 type transport system ATP-binding protein
MNVIEVNRLSKSYGTIKAVANISFQVERGEIFGMLGPNGAGKTTTMECITGLKQFTAGAVSVLGIQPGKAGRELYRKIGVQLQETSYPDKIKIGEICRMFASFYESPASYEELFIKFGLHQKKNAYVGDLSGGQRQKLSIILALLPNPEVVFLDELTTGLDPHARRSMWEYIRELKTEGRTIFMTTHYMEEAEYLCDRVGIMSGGKLVALDTVPQVIQACGIEAEIGFESEQPLLECLRKALPHGTRIERAGSRYTISGSEDGMLGKLTAWLEAAQIPYRNLNIRKPTLEDAFLKLTGIRIRGDEP